MTKSLLRFLTVISCVLGIGFSSIQPAIAQTDGGYKDFTYGNNVAPTGEKPQSKLWYHDGSWWGVLYNSSPSYLRFEIYKFNWSAQTWTTTTIPVESRQRSTLDVLSVGNDLYIASAAVPIAQNEGNPNINIYRFNYDTINTTYFFESGSTIPSNPVETVVIDQDSTGTLWITFTDIDSSTSQQSVFISHTLETPNQWSTPTVLPLTGAANLSPDDISTLVAYSGKIGVLWSNQIANSVYFGTHVDGQADDVWAPNPALQGPKYADDHLNIKSLQSDAAGQVFAAVKTSLNDGTSPNPDDPLILLLTLDNKGGWSRRTVSRVKDNQTRPIVLIDEQNRQIYVFATLRYPNQMTGAIYYKQASLDNPGMQFPDGPGTRFIELSGYTHINNASSTKQPLNSITDLLVIASDDTAKSYFHNVFDLPHSPPPSPAFSVFLPLITR